MGDILEIITSLQKRFQQDSLLITDILTCRDGALRKLRLMKVLLYLGKRESGLENGIEHFTETRRVLHNSFVRTNRRNPLEIRTEVVQAASGFLEQRLHTEQEEISKDIKQLVNTNSLPVFVKAGFSFVKRLLMKVNLLMRVAKQWDNLWDNKNMWNFVQKAALSRRQ